MKFLLLLLLVTSANTQDFSLELLTFGKSYHTDRETPYNENNTGLGLGLSYSLNNYFDYFVNLGTYKDSKYQNATFVMPGLRLVLGDRSKLHITTGLTYGYLNGSGYDGLTPLPIISLGYNWLDLCITGNPRKTTTTYKITTYYEYINIKGTYYTTTTYESRSTRVLAVFLKLTVAKF